MLSTSEVAEFVSGGSWFMVMLGGTQDHAQGVRAALLRLVVPIFKSSLWRMTIGGCHGSKINQILRID